MPAIDNREDAYKHNHFMSDHWASDDPGGYSDVDTDSSEDYDTSDNNPATDELRDTSHRRRGRNDNAATESKYRDGERSQDRHVQFTLGTKKHDAGSRPKEKKHGSKKHSKTRDNGHRKHNDTANTIRVNYPQGAFVRRHEEPTCAIL